MLTETTLLLLMFDEHVACCRGKIVDGRIQKFVSEQALLEQDTSKTVATVVREASAAIGEKVSIRRFER